MIHQIVLLVLVGVAMAETDPNTVKAVEANNRFSVELLQKLSPGNSNKNVFFSPFSISLALAMTSLGAEGNTLTEIDKAFHFDTVNTNDPKAIHQVYKALQELYNQAGKNYSLSTANRLFGQDNFEIKDQFKVDVNKYYGGELQQLDFKTGQAEGIINKWVEDQTHDKIKDLFKPGSLTPDVVLVLVNAIYFKGDWNIQFKKEDTIDDDFHTSANTKTTVKMMQMTKRLGYYYDEELKTKVLEMPYVGKDLSMFVILPDEIEGLQQVIQKLTATKLQQLFSSVVEQNVQVKFPKFKLETEYSLVDTLKALGINDLFSDSADLSAMTDTPNVVISKVIHKAMIKVNEKGTVAAAATAGVATYRSLEFKPTPQEFVTDHPFTFFIIRHPTNEIVFTGSYVKSRYGKIYKPKENEV